MIYLLKTRKNEKTYSMHASRGSICGYGRLL